MIPACNLGIRENSNKCHLKKDAYQETHKLSSVYILKMTQTNIVQGIRIYRRVNEH